jgi:hypothetical protein
MKTIIAGSRNGITLDDVYTAIDNCGWKPTSVVSGCAVGVDSMGEYWAEKNGIHVIRLPANWAEHGRSAGHIRNAEMANIADALIAVWDGKSNGTKNMIEIAKKKGLCVYVHQVGESNV